MSDTNSIFIPGYNTTNRVPGVFATVDPSQANTGTLNQRGLILGQMTSAGTATPGQAVISAGTGDARTGFGIGSLASLMVERWRALDRVGELWVLPMSDASGSAAATMVITFAGTATANAVIPLYVDGNYCPVAVNSGQTAAQVAAAAVLAVNGFTTSGGNPLFWTAVAASAVVTLTAVNKGSMGNQGTLLLSPLGTSAGQGQPGTTNAPGITATITAATGGTTDPTIATALANLPDMPFDFIVCPYNDTTSLNACQAFLGDAAGRWNWSVQLFGGVFTAKGGSLSTRTTWSVARNDQHASAIGAYGSPSPDWNWATDFAAASAVSLRADPTIPVGGLQAGVALNVMAPPLAQRDPFTARETLLFDGMSTYKVDNSGVVRVDRAITTYQFNGQGAPDNSYLSLNVPYQLMAYIRVVETMLGSQFNQMKLVANGSRIPPGSRMCTALTILASVIAQYKAICNNGIPGAPAGLCQNPAAFAAAAQGENQGGGVVALLLPVQLGNQLIAITMNVQFTQP
jgi:phage tail sheath gpL-like